MMDRLAACWGALRSYVGNRPIQFIGYFIASVMLVVALGFALSRADSNSDSIHRIESAICNSPKQTDQTRIQCRILLDRLLRDPTEAQKQRLKQLVGEGK
jgi:hypothetical protein